MARYRDRAEAGRALAEALHRYVGRDDLLVLALPRGGVPVAAEVARTLDARLDVIVVRKLGVPWQPELAMGAVASGDVLIINREIVDALGIPESDVHDAARRQREVVRRREEMYRDAWPAADVRGRVVLLIDDGLATGSTMRAAVAAVRRQLPARTIAAVPTASPTACRSLAAEVDEIVCPYTPQAFFAISESYESFPQVSDNEVRQLLDEARQRYAHRHPEGERSAAAGESSNVRHPASGAAP